NDRDGRLRRSRHRRRVVAPDRGQLPDARRLILDQRPDPGPAFAGPDFASAVTRPDPSAGKTGPGPRPLHDAVAVCCLPTASRLPPATRIRESAAPGTFAPPGWSRAPARGGMRRQPPRVARAAAADPRALR